MTTDDSQPPPTPALDAWLENHPIAGPDSIDLRYWMPKKAPYAQPDVILGNPSTGRPDRLTDPGHPVINVQLGPLKIAGFGDELEQYFTAALEMIRHARWAAERINEENADDA